MCSQEQVRQQHSFFPSSILNRWLQVYLVDGRMSFKLLSNVLQRASKVSDTSLSMLGYVVAQMEQLERDFPGQEGARQGRLGLAN